MAKSILVEWRTLEAWPANRPATPKDDRKSDNAFKAPIAQTINELEEELGMIGARDAVVEIDVDRRELRLNGEPRAMSGSRTTPGLILHFVDRRGQTITMPCDRYRTWQGNVRAIMLTLRALRAVDRYGATASGEQYRGWTALPATTTAFTIDQAASYLSRMSGNGSAAPAIAKEIEIARKAYRLAAANTHPDRGGSTGNFQLTQEAKRVLEAHFGASI